MSLKKYLRTKFDWDVSGLAAYVDEQREDLIVKSVTEARTLQYVSIQHVQEHLLRIRLFHLKLKSSITYYSYIHLN